MQKWQKYAIGFVGIAVLAGFLWMLTYQKQPPVKGPQKQNVQQQATQGDYPAEFGKIKTMMTIAEVKEILGEPTKTRYDYKEGQDRYISYVWEKNGKGIEVQFVNNLSNAIRKF